MIPIPIPIDLVWNNFKLKFILNYNICICLQKHGIFCDVLCPLTYIYWPSTFHLCHLLLRCRSSETNVFVLAFLSMHVMIICSAILEVVHSNLDFENKAVRDWLSVNFTSPRLRIKQGWRVSLRFGKFGLMFICQFLWKQTWLPSPWFASRNNHWNKLA